MIPERFPVSFPIGKATARVAIDRDSKSHYPPAKANLRNYIARRLHHAPKAEKQYVLWMLHVQNCILTCCKDIYLASKTACQNNWKNTLCAGTIGGPARHQIKEGQNWTRAETMKCTHYISFVESKHTRRRNVQLGRADSCSSNQNILCFRLGSSMSEDTTTTAGAFSAFFKLLTWTTLAHLKSSWEVNHRPWVSCHSTTSNGPVAS